MDLRRLTLQALATAIAVVAATPAGALAAKGDGPYTPFPDDPGNRALNYVNKLNQRHQGGNRGGPVAGRTGGGSQARVPKVTPESLARGVRVPQGARAAGQSKRGAEARSRRAANARGLDPGDKSPFSRAGFRQASPPPEPSVVPFLVLGAGLAVAAVGLGVFRRRRPWAS